MFKRILIIGLIAVLILGYFIQPLMNQSSENALPASFDFQDNLAVAVNEKIPLAILVEVGSVKKLELKFNDSTIQQWTKPKSKLIATLEAGIFGIGSKSIQLISTLNDGTKVIDERVVTVLSDIVPEQWSTQIVHEYPHNTASFTQGLEFLGSQMIEGTGQFGQSVLGYVSLESGLMSNPIQLDQSYFGEGITELKNNIYQLTWQQQKCFVYDAKNLTKKKDLLYTGEGWGICNNDTVLIMSDGSERLTFRDPETFELLRTIEVYTNVGPVKNLNELEYVNGLIYANVWMTNKVAVIDPISGKVIAEIDASNLVQLGKGSGDVLNGIAYRKESETYFMTGKYWPKLFEVIFSKPTV